MTIIATGIDLAKNVFAVHGVNQGGSVHLRQPKVARAKLGALIAALPPGVIGMEACSGAHYGARQFQAQGHTVRLMAPKLVTPYRMSGKRGKNDAADAAAICEAMQRPNMRFVPVKTEDQQARLMVHRAHLDERIKQYDVHVRTMARDCSAAQQLMQLMGIGETTATAIVAMVGNASEFSCGRQFAAWVGLVPGQYSSGGKTRLGRITKAGDPYLRSLLVMGARAVLNAAKGKSDGLSRWALALEKRRGYWKAVVAIAAKNARMAWAVLTKGESFKLPA